MTAPRRFTTMVGAAALLCAGIACENTVFAPRASLDRPAAVSLQVLGGSAAAFDRVDAIRVRLVRGQAAALDTTMPFRSAGDQTRVPIAIELSSATETLGLEAELRSAGSPVFRAATTATLTRGQTTSLPLQLSPVASALRAAAVPTLTAIGDSAWARAAVTFATGDTILTATPTWLSLTPTVVTAGTDGLLIARSEGQGQIVATFGIVTQTVPVTVSATVTSIGPVSPSNQSFFLNAGWVNFTAPARDRRGNLLVRTPTWTSSNTSVVVIDANGRATPAGINTGTVWIVASLGSLRDSTTLTVTNPTPSAPTQLAATPVSTSQVDLAWVDNSVNETNFRIERCAGSGCTGFVEIATVTQNVITYRDANLAEGTTYTYRVRASNIVGYSAYTNTVAVTTLTSPPVAPTSLRASTVNSTVVNLYWSDNSSNETGFRIERCAGAGCTSFAEIATVNANASAYQSTGLLPNATYQYRVRAYNGAGNSAYSNTAAVTTPPGSAPVLTGTSVTLLQTQDPGCSLYGPTWLGTSFRISFNYTDADGDVPLTGMPIGGTWWFNPSETSGSVGITFRENPRVSGNGSSGTMTTVQCYAWGTDYFVYINMTLTDQAGNTGTLPEIQIAKPAGSN